MLLQSQSRCEEFGDCQESGLTAVDEESSSIGDSPTTVSGTAGRVVVVMVTVTDI